MNLQEYWENKTIPVADIAYSNGRAILFKENWCRKKYNILEETTIEKIEKLYEEEPASIQVYNYVLNPLDNNIAYYGAVEMGNEGFVAYANNKGLLLWSMLFDFSNPFFSLEIVDDKIIATTETKFIFTIPIENPEQISCVPTHSWDIELIKGKEEKYSLDNSMNTTKKEE